MKLANPNNPEGLDVDVGDIVFRPLDHSNPTLLKAYRETGFPIGLHYGAILGKDRIITADKPMGPAVVSFDTFAAGYPVWCIKTNQPKREVARRAKKLLSEAESYNLALHNCEHVATTVGYGRPISSQVLLIRIAADVIASPAFVIAASGFLAGCILFQITNARSPPQ